MITAFTLLLLSITTSAAQTFLNSSQAVCPNQTVKYTLTSIPADYKIENASATGGTLRGTPSINNGTAEYEVTWGNGETGAIVPGLKKPKTRDDRGNITAYDDVTPSNVPSVVIKSLFGRRILAQINGTSTIDLPLCSGTQSLTLTLPQEYYASNTAYPIQEYVWSIPAAFTVVNGQPAPGFGANRWLSGRSITVSVPASQLTETVSAVLWSRECNQNAAYGNPPASLASSALRRA